MDRQIVYPEPGKNDNATISASDPYLEMEKRNIHRSRPNCGYNLGQNLLRHIAGIPILCTHPDKNAYRRKLKDRFPPPLSQCCLRQHKKYTLELLSRNNIALGVGRGANLFLLDTMVPWREIENCIEMSQQFCPGLYKMTYYSKCCIFAMEAQKIVIFGPVIPPSMSFLTN